MNTDDLPSPTTDDRLQSIHALLKLFATDLGPTTRVAVAEMVWEILSLLIDSNVFTEHPTVQDEHEGEHDATS